MFCPECRTEYRPGFTKCADCGVDLVAQLAAEQPARGHNADIPTNSEGLELLWSGVSQSVSGRIHDELAAAHLFHKLAEKEFGFSPSLAQSAQLVWIDPPDRAAARAILEKVLADSDALERPPHEELSNDNLRVNPFNFDRKVYNRVPGAEDVQNGDEDELPESQEPVADDIVEDFDPDDATTQVWSGDDRETADYLKMSLEGVGIGCVLRLDGGQFRVFVLPALESRAKEIVHEVIEGTPPQ